MLPDEIAELPIAAVLRELTDVIASNGQAVLQAPPGAGKTTGVPLAYQLDDDLKPLSREFLGDPDEIAKAAAAVAAQGKAK